MRKTLTALALAALGTTSYAGVEIASSAITLCMPAALQHVQRLS